MRRAGRIAKYSNMGYKGARVLGASLLALGVGGNLVLAQDDAVQLVAGPTSTPFIAATPSHKHDHKENGTVSVDDGNEHTVVNVGDMDDESQKQQQQQQQQQHHQDQQQQVPTLWQLITPDVVHWGCAMGAAVANAVAILRIPRAIGQLIENLGDEEADLTGSFAVLLGYVALQGVASFVLSSELRTATESLAARLKYTMFDSLMRKELGFFDSASSGHLLSQQTNDVEVIKEASYRVVKGGLQSASLAFGGLYSLYCISPMLTGALACTVPVYLGVGSVWGSYIRGMLSKARNHSAEADGHASERISNVRTVRSFGCEDREGETYKYLVESIRDEFVVANRHVGMFLGAASMMGTGLVGLLLYGGSQWDPTLSVSSLTAYLMTAQKVNGSVASLFELSSQYNGAKVAWNRCVELMSVPNAPTHASVCMTGPVQGDIAWKNVSFAYPSRPDTTVIKDFSLNVNAGTTVALCGPSGSGKSTILKLLLRMYEPSDGEVSLDSVGIAQLHPNELRSYVGVVEQYPVLWAGSIADNIAYGQQDATRDEIIAAAKKANAHEYIQRLPDQYDTILGERGVQLSGGQIQRLAIARALIRNPKIMILDEATSSQDSVSERLVQEALDVMEDQTVFIIAHRMSTIRNADLIVVMRDGAIVEQGTHEQLIQNDNLYKTLIDSQTEELD